MEISAAEFKLIRYATAFAQQGHIVLSTQALKETRYGDSKSLDFAAHTFGSLLEKLLAIVLEKGLGFSAGRAELLLILAALRFTHDGMMEIATLKEKASDIRGALQSKHTAGVLFKLQEKISVAAQE